MSDLERNSPATVRVRYWAGARAAAGVEVEEYDAVSDLTLGAVLAAVEARHGESSRLARVLATCSFLVDEQPVGRARAESYAVHAGAVVEVLPPFAGG